MLREAANPGGPEHEEEAAELFAGLELRVPSRPHP